MKKTNYFLSGLPFLLLMLSLTTMLSLSSCSKDKDDKKETETETEKKTTDDKTDTTPKFSTGKGTLVAVQSQNTTNTPIGPVTSILGTAVAVFYNTPGSTTYLDAGEVKAESKTLKRNANNSYVFQPSPTNTTGIDFSSGDVHWEVTGSANVPLIDETITMGFPSVEEISSGETVSKSSGYTLTTLSVSSADSVIFVVGNVVRTQAGNTNSYAFSSSELSGLSKGTSIAQVAAYKVEERTVNGTVYHFVNETVVSKTVTVE